MVSDKQPMCVSLKLDKSFNQTLTKLSSHKLGHLLHHRRHRGSRVQQPTGFFSRSKMSGFLLFLVSGDVGGEGEGHHLKSTVGARRRLTSPSSRCRRRRRHRRRRRRRRRRRGFWRRSMLRIFLRTTFLRPDSWARPAHSLAGT